jgi:hypothetical protein
MTVIFYPQDDELDSPDVDQKLEVLLNAAERFKASALDTSGKFGAVLSPGRQSGVPRDIPFASQFRRESARERVDRFRNTDEIRETREDAATASQRTLRRIQEAREGTSTAGQGTFRRARPDAACREAESETRRTKHDQAASNPTPRAGTRHQTSTDLASGGRRR